LALNRFEKIYNAERDGSDPSGRHVSVCTIALSPPIHTIVPCMARLSDLSKIHRSVGFVRFSLRVWQEVQKDELFTWASALAYSWLFAIFPFFIFLLALVPYLPQKIKEPAPHAIRQFVRDFLPGANDTLLDNVSKPVESLVQQRAKPLLFIGLIVALWSGSGGIAATMTALDKVYELERPRPIWRLRLLAIGVTIIVAGMLLGVVALLPVGTIVKYWFIKISHDNLSRWAPQLIAIDVVRWIAALLLMMLVLMVIYYYGPAIKQPLRLLSPGAAFVMIVWICLGLAFRYYIHTIGGKSYAKTYGTVGGVAIMLLLFYLDALVLLVGAEINSEIDFAVLHIPRGSRDFRKAVDLSEGQVDGV